MKPISEVLPALNRLNLRWRHVQSSDYSISDYTGGSDDLEQHGSWQQKRVERVVAAIIMTRSCVLCI